MPLAILLDLVSGPSLKCMPDKEAQLWLRLQISNRVSVAKGEMAAVHLITKSHNAGEGKLASIGLGEK